MQSHRVMSGLGFTQKTSNLSTIDNLIAEVSNKHEFI